MFYLHKRRTGKCASSKICKIKTEDAEEVGKVPDKIRTSLLFSLVLVPRISWTTLEADMILPFLQERDQEHKEYLEWEKWWGKKSLLTSILLFNIKEHLCLANFNMVKNMAKSTATSNKYKASALRYCVLSADTEYNQKVITASKKIKILLTIGNGWYVLLSSEQQYCFELGNWTNLSVISTLLPQ